MENGQEDEPELRIVNESGMEIGWIPGRVLPHRLTGTFILKGTFEMHPGELMTPADEPLPLDDEVFVGDEESSSLAYPGDYAVFKPHADLLLVGDALPPGGKPATVLRVEFAVGKWSKALAAIGNRTWSGGLSSRPSKPEPFMRVPLCYENSYGGQGYAPNPVGKGHEGRVLPNLEDPNRLITSKKPPPGPAGFGPIPRTWPQRRKNMGSYDGAWLKEHWPFFPPDFDWTHFNTAPVDQRLQGFLRGDEKLRLTHMHPDHPVYETQLPGVRPRWFVEQETTGSLRFQELLLHLDTLWIDMRTETAVLVWRAILPVTDRKLRDLRGHFLTVEALASEKVPLAARKEEYAALLAPPPEEPDEEEPEPAEPIGSGEEVLAQGEAERLRMHKTLLEREDRSLRYLTEQGKAHEPALDVLREDRGRFHFLGPVMAYFRALSETHPEIAKEAGAPPLPDEALYEILTRPEPPWTRMKVKVQHGKGFDFTEQDLTNLDLSDLDLEGAKFDGAILTGAVLMRAKLLGAHLKGASLDGADLREADLSSADLTDADLTGAKMDGTILAEANLEGTVFDEATMRKSDLRAARGKTASFAEADLAGARLSRSVFPESDFSGANLDGCDFSDADLTGALMKEAKGPGVVMRRAKLAGLKAAGSRFSKGNFRESEADGAIFEGADLEGAEFFGASLEEANFIQTHAPGALFSLAKLKRARFDEANLKDAKALKIDLFKGCLEGANLEGADFRGSNLFEVEFFEARTDKTDFNQANLKGTKLA